MATGPGRRHVTFPGADGSDLVGILDVPSGAIRAVALFAHCFTCDRTSRAASRVAGALTHAGYAVLRFDFTGLGDSDGSFAETTFTTNLEDLRSAARWLAEEVAAPRLLVGHSLGGAAVLAVAGELDSVGAVAVIGAPSTPDHLARLLSDAEPTPDGHLAVTIGARSLHISPDLVSDLSAQPQLRRISALRKPLLVLHSPRDAVVGIAEARAIFEAARHPKSFVSLDGADHLLLRAEDAEYAGSVIATWAGRYLAAAAPSPGAAHPAWPGVVVDELDEAEGYAHRVSAGGHSWLLDEPLDVGGTDVGPGPYDVLLSALGACTSMTMRMYARRKGWAYAPSRITLHHGRVHASDCETCEATSGQVDRVHRHIHLDPSLPDERRTALLSIADRCPVHRTLLGEIDIVTTHGPDAVPAS